MLRVLLALAMLACPIAAVAQDAVKVDPAHYKVLAENATVRVLKITYAPGEKGVMHQHPDVIVVPLVDSKTTFGMADGTSVAGDLKAGTAQYMPATTHLPTNTGTGPVEAILVEFKAAAAGTAALPTSREGMTLKALAEGARGTAYHATAGATFTEPAGSKHDFDQVVISTTPSTISLSIDGKSPKTSWARGDVALIPRGVAHESKNASGKPVELVIVAVK